jgi:hypothetical protein
MRGSRTIAIVIAVTACCVGAGCGQPSSAIRTPTAQDTGQECVQAVFSVLSGMFTKPYDNGPFEAFITRYGTQSVTYNAYLDVFTSFYSLSTAAGVTSAESRLRSTVTRDCAAS